MGTRRRCPPVIFKVNGRSGILVRDAIERIYAGLEGRDDEALPNQASVITLRLEVRSITGCEFFGDP